MLPCQGTADVQDIIPEMNVKNKLLVSHLSALSELALSAKDAFETKGEKIVEFVTKKVIDAVSPSAGVGPPHKRW
jgi:sister-chromatid-cohesion protein PDS5